MKPSEGFYFEVDTTLSHIESHFDPGYCPNVKVEYQVIYDEDWQLDQYRIVAVWETPMHKDKHLDDHLIALSMIPDEGMAVLRKVVERDANDRAHDTKLEWFGVR